MITELYSVYDIKAAKELIERNDLSFEDGFDELFGIHEEGKLVAVGSRTGNILKMLAVEPSLQGGPLLGEIVTELVTRGLGAGFESLFVYTKPEYAMTFEALNFTLLANQGRVVLMEYGKGLKSWLASKSALVRDGLNGAVVMNCNPFSLGHRYLVENAACQVDNLYIFIVREERSIFPFEVRYRLAKEGVQDLANVTVLDTSDYMVSSTTFPTYFLKKDDPAALIQMELDIILFSTRIARFFNITRRFVGTEPCCRLTDSYNDTMRRLLPVYGIELVEIERRLASSGVISASSVRDMLAAGDFQQLKDFVPPTTLAFLLSDEAEPILDKLKKNAEKKR